MFVLINDLYDDFSVVAASEDYAKLEQFKENLLLDSQKRKAFSEKVNKEYTKLIELYPFDEVAPPRKAPKPTVELKTKEEHEARRKLKESVEDKFNQWCRRVNAHLRKIRVEAKNNIVASYDKIDFDVDSEYYYYKDNLYITSCELI